MSTKRRRKYRKRSKPLSKNSKRTLSVVLIWVGAATAAVIVALIIGNVLKKKAAELDGMSTAGAEPLYTYTSDDVASVNAHRLALAGSNDDSFAAAVKSLPENVTAVSLVLRENGSSAYYSEVSLAVHGFTGGTVRLDGAVEELKKKNLYVTGYLTVESPSLKPGRARDAAMAYEAAFIGEALEAGVNDIVIAGLPTDADGVRAAGELFRLIRASVPGAVLGAAVGYAALDGDTIAFALSSYSGFADFCALDMTGSSSSGVSSAEIAARAEYYFVRYPLRAIIEDSARQAQEASLAALGIYNIQSALPGGAVAAG